LSVKDVYVAVHGSDPASYEPAMADLSPRQREILDLVAAGRTSKEIAGELGISESTVNWHISNVFGRLGASSRAEAVALAIQDDAEQDEEREGDVIEAPKSVRRPSVPARRSSASARRSSTSARRASSLPLLSIALVALTLLLGLLGGAFVAGWQVTLTPPSSTALPIGTVAPTVVPTARPSGALGPQPGAETSAPARSSGPTAEAQTLGVPSLLSPVPGLPGLPMIAPVLAPAPVEVPISPTPLPSVAPAVAPVPTVPLPTLLPVPSAMPTPSLP
jgi:DNA-binding CsgD family transcriptional regulator